MHEIVHLAQRLQAMARTGLTFAKDRYDLERYADLEGIAAHLMALGDQALAAELHEAFRRELGYATPKVDVRGVVLREGRVLLIQEPLDGLWTLPGGWADVGESPSESVVKEVREESGLLVRADRLLGVQDRNQHGYPPYAFHAYKLFFRCLEEGGTPGPGIDALAVDFFDPDDLPPLSLSRNTPDTVRWAVRAAATEGPAYFD